MGRNASTNPFETVQKIAPKLHTFRGQTLPQSTGEMN